MSLYLAMYGDKVSIGEALFISVFAMIVVFVVLLIISYLIDVSAFFINAKKNKTQVEKTGDLVKSVSNENKDQVIYNSNDTLVAVIAAAIAAYVGTSVDNVKIKSIRRVNQNTSPWSERGLLSQMEKLS